MNFSKLIPTKQHSDPSMEETVPVVDGVVCSCGDGTCKDCLMAKEDDEFEEEIESEDFWEAYDLLEECRTMIGGILTSLVISDDDKQCLEHLWEAVRQFTDSYQLHRIEERSYE